VIYLYNAIHLDTGYKAELFLLRHGDEYRKVALARRILVDFGPPLGEVYVHSPEDLIINKVHYFGLSQQSKHIRDIATIILLVGAQLDTDYIDQWNEQLNLTQTWAEMQEQIQETIDELTQ